MGNNNLLQDWNLRRKEIIDFLIAHNYLPENFEINSDYSEVKNKFFKLRNFNGRRLNVACILDEFSFESYAPECNLYQLTPENWQKEIDEINILNATKEGLTRSIKELEKNLKENGSGYEKPDVIFVDALTKIDTDSIPYKSIIHGDALSYSIAAASIIAKVTRDRIMRQWDQVYPQYGFAKHKGYGTASHIQAIKEYGICPLHRLSFVKNFINE